MGQHIKILGIATIAYHALQALIVVIIIPVFVGASLLAEDPVAVGIIGSVGTILTIVVLALALPGIIGGIGLLNHKPWSRILVLIANAFCILSFPLGTALAAYSFWVLTKEDAIDLLDG